MWNDSTLQVEKQHKGLVNKKMISRILGILLLIECGMMCLCAMVAIVYGEKSYSSFFWASFISGGIGLLFLLIGKNADRELSRRDGYCIVMATWVLFTTMGMLPFYLSGEIPRIPDAFFETMSGFSTTGATILDNIESLSHGMLFWRSLIQWIGGLGIVFFTIAVLPIFGVGNQMLASAESAGVSREKILPKISTIAKWIWGFYVAFTLTEICLLLLGGMGWFDAVCHSFCTMSTGGFSTKQASIAHWNSAYIEYVVSVFMLLASLNFSLYFILIKGQVWKWITDVETRMFLFSVGVITLIVMGILIVREQYDLEPAFRLSLFQVASIHSGTGFSTADFMLWPPVVWALFLYIMVAGGCTGSTSAGIKSMRVLIVLQSIKNELYRLMHPRAVLPIKINHHVIPASTLSTVNTFIVLYMACLFFGTVALLACNVGFIESLSLSISSLGCVGPALGNFGPAFSWSALPDVAKWITSFLMLMGRLELLGVLLMFTPGFWSKH